MLTELSLYLLHGYASKQCQVVKTYQFKLSFVLSMEIKKHMRYGIRSFHDSFVFNVSEASLTNSIDLDQPTPLGAV